MTEKIVKANGVDLCVDTFGSETDPAILLIAGSADSMEGWHPEFCTRLAAAGRFVIRYDHRDTGRSVSYEPGRPSYTGHDLEEDAVGVLDAFGLATAHIVGMSMGGGIALSLALDHPSRVASLTLISTTPGGADLPPMSDELRAVFADEAPQPDWTDRAAVIDHIIAGYQAFMGPVSMTDAELRAWAARTVDRTTNLESSQTNHWILLDAGGGEPIRPRLGTISVPTLVVHGTADPLLPFGHGACLAKEIPGARLIPLEGVGHETVPPPTWDVVVPAISALTERG